SIHIPALNNSRIYNTGNKADLLEVEAQLSTGLITAVSAGERFQQMGKKFYAFSSGSTGQAWLQNPSPDGVVIHPSFIKPASIEADIRAKVPGTDLISNKKLTKHEWATEAFIAVALAPDGPEVSTVWYSEPDGA